MTGGTAVVAKLELPEVVGWFAALLDTTSKSYVLPGVRPLSVTECAVTRVLPSAD
jgi:hypothetical protein